MYDHKHIIVVHYQVVLAVGCLGNTVHETMQGGHNGRNIAVHF